MKGTLKKPVRKARHDHDLKMKRLLFIAKKTIFETNTRKKKMLSDMMSIMGAMREAWTIIRVLRNRCAERLTKIVKKCRISKSTCVVQEDEDAVIPVISVISVIPVIPTNPLDAENMARSELAEICKLIGVVPGAVKLESFYVNDPAGTFNDATADRSIALHNLMSAAALRRNYAEIADMMFKDAGSSAAKGHIDSGYSLPMNTTTPAAMELAQNMVHDIPYAFIDCVKRMHTYMDCTPLQLIEKLDDGMMALYEEMCGDIQSESEDMEDDQVMDDDKLELHLGALDDVQDARLMDMMFVEGCKREDFGSVERIGYLEKTIAVDEMQMQMQMRIC